MRTLYRQKVTARPARRPRIRMWPIGAIVVVLAGLSALVAPARATFPGPVGKIAYTSNASGNLDIWTMTPSGGNPTDLTSNSSATDLTPSWSPDGSRIAFVSRRDAGNPEIYVMNADGSNQTRLTNELALDITPSWSPNGKQILFVSNRSGNFDVFLMNADGTHVRQLTTNPGRDSEPKFSPNGQKILYTSDLGGALALWVMAADGSGGHQLTPDSLGGAAHGDWSPDGSQIAFAGNAAVAENSDIFVMKANGTRIRQITQNLGNNQWPSWSPDGQKIALYHNPDATFSTGDIYVVNADGSGTPINITNSPTVYDEFENWGDNPE